MEIGIQNIGVGSRKSEDGGWKMEDRTRHFDPDGSGQASSVAGTPNEEQQIAAVAVGSGIPSR
jgi:hypothetical protein